MKISPEVQKIFTPDALEKFVKSYGWIDNGYATMCVSDSGTIQISIIKSQQDASDPNIIEIGKLNTSVNNSQYIISGNKTLKFSSGENVYLNVTENPDFLEININAKPKSFITPDLGKVNSPINSGEFGPTGKILFAEFQ